MSIFIELINDDDLVIKIEYIMK